MTNIKRLKGYAAQRGIRVDHMGTYGVTHILTPGQRRRASKKLRRALYGKANAVAPF